jgi:hypothetical protein
MTGAPIEQPAAAADTTTPSPTTPGGNLPAEVEAGTGGLDLLADAGDDAGGQVSEVQRLGPPEGAGDEEIATWRQQYGVPEDAAGYEAPTLDGVTWDQAALGPILEAAHEHNVPQAAVADALAKYGERVQSLRADAQRRDVENAKAARAALGEAGVAAARKAAKAMPAELRNLLNQARGPDGTKIANNPAVLKMIAAAYGSKEGRTAMTQDLKAELAEIDAAMNADAASLYQPWKTTGMSASDRKLQIARELDDAASTQARHAADRDAGSSEERELLDLHRRDPQSFEYAPWKKSGVTGAQRLYDIRQGRG